MQALRVVLTRPLAQALQWQRSLQAQGIAAHVLPLVEVASYAPCANFMPDWRACTALMFVSPSAVEFFWTPARLASLGNAGVAPPRLWAPGPGTAQALQQKGFAPEQIDQPAVTATQFESESLWHVVQTQITPGSHVLILRGADDEPATSTNANVNAKVDANAEAAATTAFAISGHGRNWLAEQIQARGGGSTAVAIYRRQCPQWSAATLATARQLQGPCNVWLFSSSQSLQHLQQLMPDADWRRTAAVATHPRIAAKAHESGFCPVLQSRPQLQDVVESIKSLYP